MSAEQNVPTIVTDVLIVGAGPAGASLACFLAFHGIKGIVISRDTSTAFQPRAHYTNPGTWECLRDIGLEDEWRRISMGREAYGDHRHCNTLAGRDLLRMYGFGRHPSVLSDYETVSPCAHGEVGQNDGEPILIKYATQHGFKLRFDTKFLRYEIEESTGLVRSFVSDLMTGSNYNIISKYLCGADGASSLIARQCGFPFHTVAGGNNAMNVWYKADLSHLHKPGDGYMHSLFTPEKDSPAWGTFGLNRVIRPYNEHLMGIATLPGASNADVSDGEVVERVRELIGDPDVEIEIKGIYRWRINETYAEVTSKDGKIFCLGDAIHRHPPANGLGSNTCIQDAYNLAWKLAFVLQGKAGPNLLESYNSERQPIAKRIVRIANDGIRTASALYSEMGLLHPTVEARMDALRYLEEDTTAGANRRAALGILFEKMVVDKSGLGGELNQAYISTAVCLDDESDPNPGWETGDAGVRHHVISTYPGSRLPHAWLATKKFGEKISTHDLAGKGHFTIFTGIGGKEPWQNAVDSGLKSVGREIEVKVRSIGHGQEFADMYGMWEARREVEENGAVLVRPDRTVAWRCKRLNKSNLEQLPHVLRKILALDQE